MNNLEEVPTTDNKLLMVKNILTSFDNDNVKYCHWKSNEHALAAVCGDTDLDILFDCDQYEVVRATLKKSGFVKFKTAWFLRYPYIEDYLGIDSIQGKIVHVHAHFKLIVGEARVKSFHLAWESEILRKRYLLQKSKIYASPVVEELLLLIIRSMLKLPIMQLGNYENKLESKDANREFDWLKKQVAEKELIELTKVYLGEKSVNCISNIYRDGINYSSLLALKKMTKEKIDEFRRYSKPKAIFLRCFRWFFARLAAVNKRLPLFNVSNHRAMPNGGLVVAVLGADGSGKSTQVKKVKSVLIKKMDTVYVYMGSGDGSSSWHRKIINLFIFIYKKLHVERNKNKNISLECLVAKNNKLKVTIPKLILGLSLALEKKFKLKEIEKAKKRGAIVITDRYPNDQFVGFNDGPIVPTIDKKFNPLRGLVAEYIHNCYRYATVVSPDLVIKLIGDPDSLHERRSGEMSKESIVFKQDGIKKLSFGKNTKVIEVNACLPKHDITKAILSEIGGLFVEESRSKNN